MINISSVIYCTNCGHQMTDDFAFCPECGTKAVRAESQQPFMTAEPAAASEVPQPIVQPDPVQPAQVQPDPVQPVNVQQGDAQPLFAVPSDGQPVQVQPPVVQQPRKPMSLGAKISIISVILVIALGVGAYFLGKYLTDEQRLFSKFEQIAKDGDADKLYELLASANEDINFDEDAAEEIADYLKDNEDVVQDLIEEWKLQAQELKSGDVESFTNSDDVPFIYLEKKDKKKWFLYNDFELKLKRYMIPVASNFEGAQILVNGERSGVIRNSNSEIEIGPLLPGNYKVEAVYKSEYTTLNNRKSIELFPMWAYNREIYLDLYGEYIYVYANNQEASIFIDGKDIGLVADGNEAIGPIALDGSNTIYVEAQYPWGVVRSEEQPVTSNVMEFNVNPITEDVENSILNATVSFAASWTDALQSMDLGLTRNATDDLLSRLEYNLSTLEMYGQRFAGSLTRVTFDMDSLSLVPYMDGTYEASIKARIESSEAVYYEGDEEVELQPVQEDVQYYLEYQDGDWFVSALFNTSEINTYNTRVFE